MVVAVGISALIAAMLVVILRLVAHGTAPMESKVAVATQVAASTALAALMTLCAGSRGASHAALSIAWGVFAAVVVMQVAIDLRTRTLPRRLSHAGLVVITLLALLAGSGTDLVHMALGAVLMTGITGMLVLISRGSLGVGDLHFSPLLGAAIGWFAPSLVVLAWVIASVTAAAVVLLLLATGQVSRRTRVPYGPFLAFGTTAAICLGAVR